MSPLLTPRVLNSWVMTDIISLARLDRIFTESPSPEAVFPVLLSTLGEVLKCDRIFLYLRHPAHQLGRVPACWCRSDRYTNLTTFEWEKEPESLSQEDPMFAAALRTEASIFVEDVETANSDVVNLAFEQREFGHRALIHAHICSEDALWGILQPEVFEQPRVWTAFDRSIMAAVGEKIVPLAIAYVKEAFEGSQV